MPSQNKWDEHWINIAKDFAKLSKDPSTKVGAVIVTPDNRQFSGGYNGFARGIDDIDPSKWERPIKYERVVHAEMNAIIQCPFDTIGCSVYTTITPCHRCLIHLVNAGIKKVVYGDTYANLTHADIWYETAELIYEIYMFKDGKRFYPKTIKT